MLRDARQASPGSSSCLSGVGTAASEQWEALAEEVSRQFRPQGSEVWSGDVYILALEHCPTGKARRRLLCAQGTCAALWRVSLCSDLPGLARKLAVWIGLSVNASPTPTLGDGPASPHCRRQLLDVQLDAGVEDAMLARALERGTTD